MWSSQYAKQEESGDDCRESAHDPALVIEHINPSIEDFGEMHEHLYCDPYANLWQQ